MKILEKLEYSHFQQMQSMEERFYPKGYITPAGEAFAWYERYPYTVVAASERGEIAGFVNLFPVSDAVFGRLREGTFNDRDLTADGIADISASETAPLHMFLSCVAVDEKYRSGRLSGALLAAAAGKYAGVAHRCDVILSDNVTAEGERLSRRYGFVPVCRSDHGSWIYSTSYARFLAMLKKTGGVTQ